MKRLVASWKAVTAFGQRPGVAVKVGDGMGATVTRASRFGFFGQHLLVAVSEFKVSLVMLTTSGSMDPQRTVSAYFRLMGVGLSSDAVTEMVGLSPDYCHDAGGVRPVGPSGTVLPPWKESLWMLEAESSSGDLCDSPIEHVVARLRGKADRIKELVDRYGGRRDFQVSIFGDWDYKYLLISSNAVLVMGQIGVGIDIGFHE